MEPVAPEFVEELTRSQLALRAYVRGAIGHGAAVDDVVQQANVVLWKKASAWQLGTPFIPWAFAVARFEVLAYFRDQKRDRLVFDEDVMEMMMGATEQVLGSLTERGEALQDCLQHIEATQREILVGKYVVGKSIAELASQFDRSQDAIKSGLLRIRKKLNQCISTKLA